MELALFYIIGIIVVISALCVVFLERPIHNVLFMIVTMIGLAGLFILLRAEFIAMVQLIVYAGAVMVLFLFVIMLLNLEQIRLPEDPSAYRRWIGVGFAALLLLVVAPFVLVFKAGKVGTLMLEKAPEVSNTEVLGRELFTTYLLPFEIASVLLLAAIIGAVVLAKRRTDDKIMH